MPVQADGYDEQADPRIVCLEALCLAESRAGHLDLDAGQEGDRNAENGETQKTRTYYTYDTCDPVVGNTVSFSTIKAAYLNLTLNSIAREQQPDFSIERDQRKLERKHLKFQKRILNHYRSDE